MPASLKTYSSFADLKRDRVVRPAGKKERLRHGKATQSLKRLKKVPRYTDLKIKIDRNRDFR